MPKLTPEEIAQAHLKAAAQATMAAPSLSASPMISSTALSDSGSGTGTGAVVSSAAPVLRNLKAELTRMVPASVMKRRQQVQSKQQQQQQEQQQQQQQQPSSPSSQVMQVPAQETIIEVKEDHDRTTSTTSNGIGASPVPSSFLFSNLPALPDDVDVDELDEDTLLAMHEESMNQHSSALSFAGFKSLK
jgi:hypothetical protein